MLFTIKVNVLFNLNNGLLIIKFNSKASNIVFASKSKEVGAGSGQRMQTMENYYVLFYWLTLADSGIVAIAANNNNKQHREHKHNALS